MGFGAVFGYCKSYGTVRLRFGAVIYPAVRFGAVFKNRKCLRCGSFFSCFLQCDWVRFSEMKNPTVRFGAVFGYSKFYGAVRCC